MVKTLCTHFHKEPGDKYLVLIQKEEVLLLLHTLVYRTVDIRSLVSTDSPEVEGLEAGELVHDRRNLS